MVGAVRSSHPIKYLLEAESIAVVGASADPLKIGGRPIEYLRRFGFTGRIIPVNPQRREIQSLPCIPRLTDESAAELAIIATAAPDALISLTDCLAAGCKGIVIFSAGFAEFNPEGRALQERFARMADEAGAVLLGPNCLGTINAHSRLVATFTTALEHSQLPVGGFSYFGQSGALGAYWIEKVEASGLGVAKWITTGNECHISLADALLYLAQDPETTLIGAYIEDIKQPERFVEAARIARSAGKPVLAIKSGRSKPGKRAVSAHTGAVAGEDEWYEEILKACGIVRVDSLTEMVDVGRLLLSNPPPRAPSRLAVVTVSGGAGALICDAASDVGLDVPDLSADMRRRLDKLLPSFVLRQNPIDVTGAVVSNAPMLGDVLTALASCAEFDTIVIFLGLMSSIKDGLIEAVKGARALGKPLVLIWVGASTESLQALRDCGIPVFADIPTTLRALAKTVVMS
jgi:acetate---CoA ligase (ADP-forming)